MVSDVRIDSNTPASRQTPGARPRIGLDMTSVPSITCSTCGESKPLDEIKKLYKSGTRGRCRVCVNIAQNQRYHALKDSPGFKKSKKADALWAYYRLRPEDWNRIWQAQGEGCGICGCSETESIAKDRFGLVVDHDHSCCPGAKSCGKCVRGILCKPCNTGIGYFKDAPERLEEAARYLRTASP